MYIILKDLEDECIFDRFILFMLIFLFLYLYILFEGNLEFDDGVGFLL